MDFFDVGHPQQSASIDENAITNFGAEASAATPMGQYFLVTLPGEMAVRIVGQMSLRDIRNARVTFVGTKPVLDQMGFTTCKELTLLLASPASSKVA